MNALVLVLLLVGQILERAGQEGEVALLAAVRVVTLLAALVAGHLVQRPVLFVAVLSVVRIVVVIQVVLLHHRVLLLLVLLRLQLGCEDLFAFLRTELRAGVDLVAGGRAVVTDHLTFLELHTRIAGGQVESRVHMLAVGAQRTEAAQVVHADDASRMSMPAVRSVSTEPPIVPGTVLDLRLRIDVQVLAVLVGARLELRVEVALGHLGHVVLVQELAQIALLAQAAQPVLADHRSVGFDVSVRAGRSAFADAFQVENTDGSSGFVHALRRGRAASLVGRWRQLENEIKKLKFAVRFMANIWRAKELTWKRQWQQADLLLQRDLHIELNVVHIGQNLLHFCLGFWAGRSLCLNQFESL